jgi:hypothetical protein
MKKTFLIITLFITGICFGQDEIIHISKTHQDGTPKKVILYERLNDNLRSDNPFRILDKFSYDEKGKYIRLRLTGDAKKAERIIIGNWGSDESVDDYVTFNKDRSYDVYEDSELDEDESGVWLLTQEGDDIILLYKEHGRDQYMTDKIVFTNKNQFVLSSKTFNRKK